MKRRALFSLNDTTDAGQFAGVLIAQGWEIMATSETVEILKKQGLPVTNIADFTGVKEDYGFPPTLHPKVEHALTADAQERIDLVYVIPYPRSKGNDVGGRTLLALAVKGGRITVMDIADMRSVVSALSKGDRLPEDMACALADKACFEIAQHYCSLIEDRTRYDFLNGRYFSSLLNGENPYQIPASFFRTEPENDPLTLDGFSRIAGEPACFTNMADADSILRTLCLAAEAFRINLGCVPHLCVVAKHGNACGIGASRETPVEAIEKALFGNPRSIWGGEMIVNFPIDEEMAEHVFKSKRREKLLGDGSWMLDVVMAPSFAPEAVSVLGRRSRRKLFANTALASPVLKNVGHEYRPVRGGFLRQPPASYVLNIRECLLDGQPLAESEIASILVAWAVAFSSNHGGNEIALAKDGALLGAGGGPSTVEAASVAVERALECGHGLKGAAFSADAFFPFTDAPAILSDAGLTSGCAPAGGSYEGDVRKFFREHGVTMIYLPERYRGFCRH